MSKLMGKTFLRILKDKDFDVVKGSCVNVKYLRTSCCYEFKFVDSPRPSKFLEEVESGIKLEDIGEGFYKYRLKVSMVDLFKLLDADKNKDLFLVWSLGYKNGVVEKEYQKILEKEMSFISSSDLDVGTYLDLCYIQEVFCLSQNLLNRISGKRRKNQERQACQKSQDSSIFLQVRNNNKGRKKGSLRKKGKDKDKESEESLTYEEYEHNKKVALDKGVLAWYLEACKGQEKKFDKGQVEVWKKEFYEKRNCQSMEEVIK